MTLETIIVEQPIKARPDQVWARISTPDGIARWWAPGDIAPIVGHEFKMNMGEWGLVPCQILAVVPNEKLVYRFDDFELHWTIVPSETGCTLQLEHRGFDLDKPNHRFAFENMGVGWRTMVLPRLVEDLLPAA